MRYGTFDHVNLVGEEYGEHETKRDVITDRVCGILSLVSVQKILECRPHTMNIGTGVDDAQTAEAVSRRID